MKRTRRSLFVLFYIAATIAVAGYHSARAADWLEHATGSFETRLSSPCQPVVKTLPTFSHAKRIRGSEVTGTCVLARFWFTDLPGRNLEFQPRIESGSRLDAESTDARAPPPLI